MANTQTPQLSQEEVARLRAIRAQNAQILLTSQKEWVQFGNDLGQGSSPNYGIQTNYKFSLSNVSGYLDVIRVWLHNVKLDNSNTATASTLNRYGLYTLLGQLQVRLGNNIFKLPAAALGVLVNTMNRFGNLPGHGGNNSYNYSTKLFNAPSTINASSNGVYTGYIDIPLALLQQVGDPDGLAPTLSNTGIEVSFTTPNALVGTDVMVNPLTGGTVAVDGSAPGTIDVWARMLRQVTVSDTAPLPAPVVGPAFIVEAVNTALNVAANQENFFPFQGQQSNLILLRSIMVIDSPGELANEFADNQNLLQAGLYYDAKTPVYDSRQAQNPLYSSYGGLMNELVDQRQKFGDLPPGVTVFDFMGGTNADYPNSTAYLNLQKFSRAGVKLELGQAPQTGAQLYFINVYLNPNFYVGQG